MHCSSCHESAHTFAGMCCLRHQSGVTVAAVRSELSGVQLLMREDCVQEAHGQVCAWCLLHPRSILTSNCRNRLSGMTLPLDVKVCPLSVHTHNFWEGTDTCMYRTACLPAYLSGSTPPCALDRSISCCTFVAPLLVAQLPPSPSLCPGRLGLTPHRSSCSSPGPRMASDSTRQSNRCDSALTDLATGCLEAAKLQRRAAVGIERKVRCSPRLPTGKQRDGFCTPRRAALGSPAPSS